MKMVPNRIAKKNHANVVSVAEAVADSVVEEEEARDLMVSYQLNLLQESRFFYFFKNLIQLIQVVAHMEVAVVVDASDEDQDVKEVINKTFL